MTRVLTFNPNDIEDPEELARIMTEEGWRQIDQHGLMWVDEIEARMGKP